MDARGHYYPSGGDALCLFSGRRVKRGLYPEAAGKPAPFTESRYRSALRA